MPAFSLPRPFFRPLPLLVVLLLSACGAFEDDLSYVCDGTTETVQLRDGAVIAREVSHSRRFIAIKQRQINGNNCPIWNQGRITCQSALKGTEHPGDLPAYQLNIDRDSGEVSEHSETPELQRIFKGKCVPYKGPKLG